MINATIGKYKLTRLIGEGGMASVYEAKHEMLGTKVAIKVLNPILSANTQIKERFRNEAKLMASLDHPNITKVIDFDEQPQQLSIVMEYLNGEDLNQKIKMNGPLSEKEITDVFSQALSAFQYAHEKGIVHRDIKPSNIFVLPNGLIKVLDFGIAKLFGQSNEISQSGTLMGTPVYMSPEQVKADKSIDLRSDIYSLGVTLFFTINGKPPYNSDTDSQYDIFNKILNESLPEFSIQSKFKEIVLKACQKNREDRFQNCSELNKYLKINEKIDQTIDENDQNKTKNSSINENTVEENDQVETIIQTENKSQSNKSPKINKTIVLKIIFATILLFTLMIIGLYYVKNMGVYYVVLKNNLTIKEAIDLMENTNNSSVFSSNGLSSRILKLRNGKYELILQNGYIIEAKADSDLEKVKSLQSQFKPYKTRPIKGVDYFKKLRYLQNDIFN